MRLSVLVLSTGLGAAATVEFNRDVRPILSDRCFSCHGPDAKTKNIPLRLDVEADAKAERGGRRAIVAGNPAASVLLDRVTAAKPAMRMPPAHTGPALSVKEIATLRTWIAEGAVWQKHWSLLAPVRAALPKVRNTAWPRNGIDHFVLARLEREGLAPAPAASKETWLRRASLDLTGLGPSPAEVDAFLGDTSAQAYEKAADRLLASPRYGERMAARWLDAARYADTNGYQFDGERQMWRWRDWVIASFNRNQPYDRFVTEQLAGDLLPGATMDQKLATGFNRNHRGNSEDGIVPEEFATEYVVDRVETASTVFLGLTLGCARCHNHKYDPFTQKDFYQLFAYFNNIPEAGRVMKYGNSPPLIAAPVPAQQAALDTLEGRIAKEEAFLAGHRAPEAGSGAIEWWPRAGLASWFDFEYRENAEPAGRFGKAAKLDGKTAIELPGVAAFDIDDAFSLAAWIYPETRTGAIVSRMSDEAKGKGFGVYLRDGKVHVHITSNYADDAIRLDTKAAVTEGRWSHVAVTYDATVQAEGIRVYIDGKPAEFTVTENSLYRPFRNAGRNYKEAFRIGAGGGAENRFTGRIDDVLVYSRVLEPGEAALIAGAAPRAEVARAAWLDSTAPSGLNAAWRRLGELKYERERLKRTFPTAMVMSELAVRKQSHILIRGAYDKKGEPVEPGVPAVLPPLPSAAPNNRLGLAQWLTQPDHPLTARVAVNRFWQMYFGTGIVKTVEDFGTQGEWPSHPELLDWLATEFVRGGWNIKAMQKMIVTSAAYRQSSRATPELVERDPENRLLARGPRFRLPAEMLRDNALHAAGLLKESLGGPSVKPYQPEGLWNELAMQDMYYVQGKGDDLYRRSLYTFWKRTIAPPMMITFDAANREACVVRETRTNTPLQALNLMNDVTFLEAARRVAERMIAEGGSASESRLRHGFRLVLAREPKPEERRIAAASLSYHLDYFADAEKAARFAKQGDSAPRSGVDPRQLAAYTAVASLLFNLDEAVTKE